MAEGPRDRLRRVPRAPGHALRRRGAGGLPPRRPGGDAPVAYHLVRHTEYRWQRIVAFLEPARFKDTIGFQLWESLLLTSKGGWLGQGLGQGRGRLYYLPAAHTDFVAAVIAEEAGLAGLGLLVGLFAIVIWRGVRATSARQGRVRMLRRAGH